MRFFSLGFKNFAQRAAKYTAYLILSNSLLVLKKSFKHIIIDLFLTNNANCFQKSSVFKTVPSDFLILSNSLLVLKKSFKHIIIDLFLTNNANCFQKSSVFKTVPSDFHKLIVTVIKSRSPKQHAQVIKYRN